jgi:hypothetical protein
MHQPIQSTSKFDDLMIPHYESIVRTVINEVIFEIKYKRIK